MARIHLKFLILFAGLILVPSVLLAQETKTLREAIVQAEEKFNVKFSFADESITNLQVTVEETDSITNFIAQIQAQTALEISTISERYYAIVLPKTVSICGFVLDNFAKNSIPGATIELLGTEKALVTNLDGSFSIENLSREASLRFRYLGYETKIVPVSDFLKTKECVKILLAERREQLREVVVYQFLTSGITREKDASIALDLSKLGVLPGVIEPDILQSVQALPGIKSINETVSDINVRGGTNDQNLILWNNIKIYQSGHFFGLISAFNPYLIEDISIYKNGTPSNFGDGVSSVISMKTNNELNGYFTGGGGINFITGDIYGQVPINNKTEFQFSARRSATDFLNTPTYNSFTERAFQDSEVQNQQGQNTTGDYERNEDFYFYDFSGKLLYDYNEDYKLRLSFIVMDNDLDYLETNLNSNETTQSFLDQTNISVGLQWLAQWSSNFSSEANAYFSNYDLNAIGIEANQIQRLNQKNQVDERALKINTFYNPHKQVTWQNGFQYVETGITNKAFVTQPPFDTNRKGVIRIYAPFTSITYNSFEDNFITTIGLRANYIDNLGTFTALLFEPRLNMNFKIARNLRGQVLGEFKSQTTNQVIDLEQNFLGIEKRRWILSNDANLPITKSKQGSIGLNYDYNGLYLGGEFFYKKVDGISLLTQGFQNENQFNGDEIGSYDVKGFEFLINKKSGLFSNWLSYTYNTNNYTFENIPPNSFPNNLDVRHSITAATTFQKNNLGLGLGLNYRTGKPFTKPNEENSLNVQTFPAEINYEEPNSSRLPEYLRLDASATYNFQLSRRVKAKAGVSLLNITNRKNILNTYYRVNNANEIETIENKSLGLTPNLTFRVSF